MDTKLVAKVLSPKKNGKRAIGTAYPIAKGLLITARHVVDFDERNLNEKITVEWPDIKDESKEFFSREVSEIVFNEGPDCDVAILACETPMSVIALILDEVFPKVHDPWESFGYPELGKHSKTQTREKIPLMGKFHSPDDNKSEISLTSESDALKKTDWAGVSGAPVFKGKNLLAVIVATPKKRQECFSAVLLPWLMKNEQTFRDTVKQPINEAINQQHTVFINRVIKEIEYILKNSNISDKDLKKELRLVDSASHQDIARYLVEELSVVQAITKITRILRQQQDSSQTQPKEWGHYLYDANQICGWLLIKTVDSKWWYQKGQTLGKNVNQSITNEISLDNPDYVEIIISRSCLQPARYLNDKLGKAKPDAFKLDEELMFDAIAEDAVNTQLLSQLYKDLHPGAPKQPTELADLLENIKNRARARYNLNNKIIYYLISKDNLKVLKSTYWFDTIEKDLSGYLQFIHCSLKDKPDDDQPSTEDQTELLEQLALLLEMDTQDN